MQEVTGSNRRRGLVEEGNPGSGSVDEHLQELLVPGNVMKSPRSFPSDDELQESYESLGGCSSLVPVLHLCDMVSRLDNRGDGKDEKSALLSSASRHFRDDLLCILVEKRNAREVAHH
ncbi:hypothetical protein QP028_08825 [Corynebacterium suedekumii]|nr:hypothetical protein QP028_08825 [Corynebacterium suedekumii]